VTKAHVGSKGMRVSDLCAAAVTVSDNAAANLLLASFGGPAALTNFWRSVGDSVTRLDRNEPALNEGTPGDSRDTTSPAAMAEDLHKFVLGDVLHPASRELLKKWLIGNKTGDTRLRAGLTRGWVTGDKTGTGGHNSTNDIAVVWPANRKPFVIAAYLTQGTGAAADEDAILADVGRAVAGEIASAV
jgi:beta-lactamase class A